MWTYQKQLNLTKPRCAATGFEFKHDYTVIDSPRAVTFRDKYGVQMIMRFNEIHKFSDGTLQQIDEALDYRVKEFQINRSVLTDQEVNPTRLGRMTKPYSPTSFIANRFITGSSKNWRWRHLVPVESIHHAMLTLNAPIAQPSLATQDPSKDSCFISHGDQYNSIVSLTPIKISRVLRIILVVLPEHPSDTKVLTMKMEILLEPTSNKLLEIRLKMNLPDHRIQAKMEMETLRSSRVDSPPNAHS
ncbi:hypothetical protein Tco_0638482 [Tanacetum coccineum]